MGANLQLASNVGARLRGLRIAAGLTQADVSRRTGIHRPIVSRIERGVHVPGLVTIRRYTRAVAADVGDAIDERRVDALVLSKGLTRGGRPFARARAV